MNAPLAVPKRLRVGISMLGVEKQMGGNYQYATTMLADLVQLKGKASIELVVFCGSQAQVAELATIGGEAEFVVLNRAPQPGGWLRRILRVTYGLGLPFGRKFASGGYECIDEAGCEVVFHPYWGTAAFITRTPAVVAIHDCAPRELRDLKWQTRVQLEILIRSIVRHAQVLLVDSNQGRDALGRYYGVSQDRIAVRPLRPPAYLLNAIGKTSRAALLDGLPDRYFFLPGRWGSYKNTQRVMAAFKLVLAKDCTCRDLVLVGMRNEDLAEADKEIERLKLKGRVHVLGFVSDDEVAALYGKATALVFPTLLGPTSIPIYEALAMACPVVVADMTGYREQTGGAALFVDPYNVEEIAAAMMRIVDDEALRARLVEQGRNRMREVLAIDYPGTLLSWGREAIAMTSRAKGKLG